MRGSSYLSLALGLWCLACGSEEPGEAGEALSLFGATDRRQLTTLADANEGLATPRSVAFHPDRPNELWTANRELDGTVILFDPGAAGERRERIVDAYGNHFMEEVSAMAFGADDTFATCQESRNTYDHQARANDFMGPALWSADLAVYGKVGQTGNLLGSHLDMLHQSPLCMGIAHDHDNVYWVFDGLNGHVVYYDFQRDHGPGHDDHSDGIVRRYTDATLTRVDNVPGHMVLDHASGWLYVADTGGARVLRLDTRSGQRRRALAQTNEPLAEYSEYTGATVEVFAADGLLHPSGLALHDGVLFVGDQANGDIRAYDIDSGALLDTLSTGAPGLMGLTVGPDERLYYVNGPQDRLVRIDP